MKYILNFRHSGLVTKNMKKSLRFYNKILGFKIIRKTVEDKKYIEKLLKINDGNLTHYKLGYKNNPFLELLEFKKKSINKPLKLNQNGLTHLSFTVQNIEKFVKKLKKFNVKFNSKILTSKDKKVKLVFCKTPENIYLEFVQEL